MRTPDDVCCRERTPHPRVDENSRGDFSRDAPVDGKSRDAAEGSYNGNNEVGVKSRAVAPDFLRSNPKG
ncbi:hypothetical protein RDV89_10700 [Nocardioides zeae]|uniref:Uncharacterized protein n=1 Tax=Nocardioides imazamoxiresistens TaxID=3231893 RepID=A0ABU3PWD7_9ACTN|nr:hypothetical protein [Nocardioides zeae]MDT9593537.1 hypothetical protein [Nocardioides zeae]